MILNNSKIFNNNLKNNDLNFVVNSNRITNCVSNLKKSRNSGNKKIRVNKGKGLIIKESIKDELK